MGFQRYGRLVSRASVPSCIAAGSCRRGVDSPEALAMMALRRASTRSCRTKETENPREEVQNAGATKRKRPRQIQAHGGQKRGLKADRHAQLDENVRLSTPLVGVVCALLLPRVGREGAERRRVGFLRMCNL